MKINVVGSLFGIIGYDIHTKGLVNALYKQNPDIKLDVPLPPNWLQMANDEELKMIKTTYRVPDVTIAIMSPPNWRIALGDNCKHFVGYCVWEGDKIPLSWLDYLMDERVDQIWVPSKHTRMAIYSTINYRLNSLYKPDKILTNKLMIMKDKIKIIPHGYDPKIFYSQRKKDKDDCSNVSLSGDTKQLQGKKIKDEHMLVDKDNHVDIFHFITNKGWRGGMEDRGGVQFLLQAYANEFKKDENVELLIKLNPSYINPESVKQKIDELKLPKNAAKIKVACSNMTPEQICELYNQSDVYVCATRAEAFDLGTAEAMAYGLPIITTGYGGQIEHMDKSCADFIDYELKEVQNDVLYEGIKQACPSIQHLQKLLREAFLRRDITKEKGVKAQKFISSWTWDESAKKVMIFLGELK